MKKDYKTILEKILYPKWYLVLTFVVVATLGLVWCFSKGLDETALAYFLYAFSFYSLVVACLGLVKLWKKCIWPFIDSVPFFHRMIFDVKYRALFFTKFSLTVNILYGLLQIGMGIYYKSLWFGTLGFYYLLLLNVRGALVRGIKPETVGKDLNTEYKKYRSCGFFLLFMNIIISGIIIMIFDDGQTFEYPGTLIYAMAAYAFYAVGLAIYGMISYRKYKSPLLSATRAVNLACGLLSMLSLETAMLHQFGSADGARFFAVMIGISGFGFTIAYTIIGIYMIVNATRNLKSN